MSIGKDIIRQDEELYNKYAEILLDLIKKGKLKPVVRSLFRENKSLILSEEKIKDFLVEQTQPTILPLTDELVDFARQEEKALGEYLLNELLEFLKDEEV